MPELSIAKPLLPFLEKKKRFKIAIGGRGSGKSMSVADLCLKDAMTRGIKTVCFREFQRSIDDSVLALLEAEIGRLELKGFKCQNQAILYNGKEMFKFGGMARNVEGIKSMHGFHRAWVEEAQTMSYQSLEILTPTIREKDSEIWMTANLRSMADPFSQRFFKPFEKELRRNGYYEDDLHLIVIINHNDSPFFPEVLEKERAFDEKNMTKAKYDHIWGGDPYDEVHASIIPAEWFDAAINAHVKLGFEPSGSKFVSFDPFNGGSDAHGYAYRHGSVYLDICENEEGDANDGMAWAANRAMGVGADHFRYDATGAMGLKLQVDNLFKHAKIEYHLFNGGESPDDPDFIYEPVNGESVGNSKSNKDTFLNKRAQGYFRLADRFFRTYQAVDRHDKGLPPINMDPEKMISLSEDIDGLDSIRAEVCRIPQKINPNGKKQILSKPEMAKKPYELPSPNMADCMMMNEFVPEVALKYKPLSFNGG